PASGQMLPPTQRTRIALPASFWHAGSGPLLGSPFDCGDSDALRRWAEEPPDAGGQWQGRILRLLSSRREPPEFSLNERQVRAADPKRDSLSAPSGLAERAPSVPKSCPPRAYSGPFRRTRAHNDTTSSSLHEVRG